MAFLQYVVNADLGVAFVPGDRTLVYVPALAGVAATAGVTAVAGVTDIAGVAPLASV